MVEPVPKWLMRRYAVLWSHFKDKEFDHDQACKVLKESKAIVSLSLSEMKRSGWLEVKMNPHDTRKRLYRLVSPQKAVEMLKVDSIGGKVKDR